MKTALITGILGQDGSYLARLLLEKDYKVYGLVKRESNPNFLNLDYLRITDRVECFSGDLTDEASLINVIKTIRPDEVYNLGAQSLGASSWDQAKLTTDVNALGVLYLLSAIKYFSPLTKFYQASSSEMFGNSGINGLQDEETPFHPRNPYAISKLYAYWMTNSFKERYGMFCCNGILFNHESPIRGKEFVSRKISDGVARIRLGLANEIRLGNLDSKRDWGFAADYVRAMYLMMQQEKPDNFIISTGEIHSLKDFLKISFDHVKISGWEKYIVIDPRFKRPTESVTLQGRSDKARKVLGWKPEVKFEELVKMMVDADLQRLKK
jgi:GDPmannose 4,6-dehydratase